jgi:hypothetical protein
MRLMSDTNFKVIFRGPAVDDGEIDVRDLAPALLALGDVFQAASDILCPSANDLRQLGV